jgi:hypothetical protein
MKHVVALILSLIMLGLCIPIMLIKWNTEGMDDIISGIEKMCGVEGWGG